MNTEAHVIRRIIALSVMVCWLTLSAKAQFSAERSALKNIRSQKWINARIRLEKLLHKDSLNVPARYVYAIYFAEPQSPTHNPDSAYLNITMALKSYGNTTRKARERMRRFPLDSVGIINFRERIDSAAFVLAKQINTEEGYIHFLKVYEFAAQRNLAVDLRNESAFLSASNLNTPESFNAFVLKYPTSTQANEATERYHRLLYKNAVSDKRLESYLQFLKTHPDTPYKTDIQKNVFEIITASGSEESFIDFLRLYPESPYAKKSRDMLYHIQLENESHHLSQLLDTDSIHAVQLLNESFVVPILKDHKFGLMNAQGIEVMPPGEREIDKEYLCGNIQEDVIKFSNGILTRNGNAIFQGEIEEMEDLGYGFLKIDNGKQIYAVHKSGYRINEDFIEDVRVIKGRFLIVKKEDHWSLLTMTGRRLTAYNFDNIDLIGTVIIFKKKDRYILSNHSQIEKLTEGQTLNISDEFDNVKAFPHGLIWVKAGEYEGVFDQALHTVIAFDKHSISSAFFGLISSSFRGNRLCDWNGNAMGIYPEIKTSESWLAVRQADVWSFLDHVTMKLSERSFDSISYLGPFALGITRDSIRVFLKHNLHADFTSETKFDFIPGKDSSAFIQTEVNLKKTIYDSDGIKLFTCDCDKIQYVDQNIFLVTKRDKKGLVTMSGRPLLPIEYDAIAGSNSIVISVLKDTKFGLYDITSRKLIKPRYDKNLTPYNNQLVVAHQDGFNGFIDWQNKPQSKFEFEEIQYWNDSVALVKKNSQWMLYEIATNKILVDNIRDFKILSDSKAERVAVIHHENAYGVISSQKGIIIPLEFTDVKNLGSTEQPLYFTEKHVEEASLFIVVYYNSSGKIVKREVYNEEDYDRLYCSHN